MKNNPNSYHHNQKRAHIPSREEAGYEDANPEVQEGKEKLDLPKNPVVHRGQNPELFWMEKGQKSRLLHHHWRTRCGIGGRRVYPIWPNKVPAAKPSSPSKLKSTMKLSTGFTVSAHIRSKQSEASALQCG